MCNCGNKRNSGIGREQSVSLHHDADVAGISFRYTGHTSITVIGNVSGKRYRFEQPGDVQKVDLRDARGMMTIQVLRRVY